MGNSFVTSFPFFFLQFFFFLFLFIVLHASWHTLPIQYACCHEGVATGMQYSSFLFHFGLFLFLSTFVPILLPFDTHLFDFLRIPAPLLTFDIYCFDLQFHVWRLLETSVLLIKMKLESCQEYVENFFKVRGHDD